MKKVFIGFMIVIGVIVLLIGITIGVFAYVKSSNNSYKGDFKTTLQAGDTSAKKALVVFQPSMNSKSKNIADQIAKGLNDDGYEVTLSYPGKHLSPDVKDYSVLVFGSPVIVGQPSEALTDYIKGLQNTDGKKVAIYSVGSMDDTPELDLIAKSFKSASISQKTKFKGDDKNNQDAAYKFGAELGKD